MTKVDFTHSGQPVTHGKASSYNNHKCRCDECRAAWAEYMRPRIKDYRDKKRQKTQHVKINL